MRKPNAPLRIEDLLPLCREARVSLDWVATGYQVRPDLVMPQPPGLAPPPQGITGRPALAETVERGFDALPGFVRLLPLRPGLTQQGTATVELWTPSEIAVTTQWLEARFGLTPDSARYALLDDDGQAPRLPKGALVILDIRPVQPRSGIYLVGVGDELLARRLNRMPDGNSELVADADPGWRYLLRDGAAIPILHRIVWAGQDT